MLGFFGGEGGLNNTKNNIPLYIYTLHLLSYSSIDNLKFEYILTILHFYSLPTTMNVFGVLLHIVLYCVSLNYVSSI